jgi:hypothetical protein
MTTLNISRSDAMNQSVEADMKRTGIGSASDCVEPRDGGERSPLEAASD